MSQFARLFVVDQDDPDSVDTESFVNLDDVARIIPRAGHRDGSILYFRGTHSAVFVRETMDEIGSLTAVSRTRTTRDLRPANPAPKTPVFTLNDLALLESLGATGGFVASDETAKRITSLADRIKAEIRPPEDEDDDLPF